MFISSVKCIWLPIGEVPKYWDKLPVDPATGKEVPVHVVDLVPGGPEYAMVESEFHKTMHVQSVATQLQASLGVVGPQLGRIRAQPPNYNSIVRIQRVQNPTQYGLYSTKKREMDKHNPDGHPNEMKLFHGTRHDTCAKINSQSFNRSYAGQNGL